MTIWSNAVQALGDGLTTGLTFFEASSGFNRKDIEPSSMLLDLSGKNLQDDDIIHVLQEKFGTDMNRNVQLDMTFNRLTLSGLDAIIDFMRPRRNMRACVGENSFHFPPFFKTMQERGVESWIDSERLTMGSTTISKDADRLLAGCMRDSDGIEALRQFNLEMHRRQDERWAREDERREMYVVAEAQRKKEADERWDRNQSRIQEEAAQRKIELDAMNKKNDEEAAQRKMELDAMNKNNDEKAAQRKIELDAMNKKNEEKAAQRKMELDAMNKKNETVSSEMTEQFKQLFGYHHNRNRQIEEEVEEAVRLYCETLGCTDDDDFQVYSHNLHLVKGKNKQKLFEWDGLVTAQIGGQKTLFLIEAKHFVTEEHVTGMARRIAITRKFIQDAAQEDLSTCKPRYAYQAGVYAGFRGHIIRGVVGGASVIEAMKDKILELGYYLVRLENLEYSVTPPAALAEC